MSTFLQHHVATSPRSHWLTTGWKYQLSPYVLQITQDEEVVDLARVYPTTDLQSWPVEEFLKGYLPRGGERE